MLLWETTTSSTMLIDSVKKRMLTVVGFDFTDISQQHDLFMYIVAEGHLHCQLYKMCGLQYLKG